MREQQNYNYHKLPAVKKRIEENKDEKEDPGKLKRKTALHRRIGA